MSGWGRGVALAVLLALGACAAPQPAAPDLLVLAPEGKDPAQFQREDAACGEAEQPPAEATPVPEIPAEAPRRDEEGYLRCMVAAGNVVATAVAGRPYPYANGGPPYLYRPYLGGASLALGYVVVRHHPHRHWGGPPRFAGLHHGGGRRR